MRRGGGGRQAGCGWRRAAAEKRYIRNICMKEEKKKRNEKHGVTV
jgi:hypothetical protein